MKKQTRKNKKNIVNLEDLIYRFGGPRKVEKDIGLSHTTIYNLLKRKKSIRLTPESAIKLHKFARKKGLSFDIGKYYPEYKDTFK